MEYSVEYLCAKEYIRRLSSNGRPYEIVFPGAEAIQTEALNDLSLLTDEEYSFIKQYVDTLNQGEEQSILPDSGADTN